MSEIKKVAKYSAFITFILALSKLVGFLREMLIAIKFGATIESDIFKIASTMPQTLFATVAAAIVTSFIPIFAGVKNDRKKANDFFNNVLNIVFIICLFIMFIGIILSPQLTKLFAAGFEGENFQRTVSMTRILMPSIVFLGISGLYTGYLQSYGVFIQPALTGISASLLIIIGILVFAQYGIAAAVIATLLGSVAQVWIQRPFMRDYKFRFLIDLKDQNAIRMLRLAVPTIISTMITQISPMVGKNFASRLAEGSISVYDYAFKISTVINQVFILSITTVLYPSMTEKYAAGQMEEFKDLIARSINMVLIVSIPLLFGLSALSEPVVKVLLEHGKFDSEATRLTALSLRYLAFGTLGYSLIDVLSKIFYAARNTFIPMVIGIFNAAISIAFIMIFAPSMGVSGLSFATALTACVVALVMIIVLNYLLKGIKLKKIVIAFLKTFAAGGVMAIAVSMVFKLLSSFLAGSTLLYMLNLFAASAFGMFVYFLLMSFLKVEEFKTVYNMTFGKLKFKRNSR